MDRLNDAAFAAGYRKACVASAECFGNQQSAISNQQSAISNQKSEISNQKIP
jgi:hypothetical protein